jgi:hypothetical protein
VGLPAHAAWPWAALLPRAGPQLTADPLGLLFGALAAGLAIVWLMAALLGAATRWRVALGALALVVLVAAPAAVMATVGTATGTPRAQDEWFLSVSREARRALGQADPAPVREAWSISFRRDPPGPLPGDAAGTPPSRALGRLLGSAGMADPRPLLAAAMVMAGALAVLLVRGASAPLALGAVALVPAAVVGAVFGAGNALLLAFVLGGLLLGRRALGGILLGVAAAFSPRLALIAPLLLPLEVGLLPLAAGGLAFAATLGASVLIGGSAWAGPQLVPSLGLPNLMLYAGAATLPKWLPPALLVLNLTALAVLAKRRHESGPALAEAAALLLASLWLSPATSAHDLALPLGLLTLAALRPSESKIPA